jgi:hypothetical protein
MSGIALAGLDGGYVEVTPQQLGDLESRAAGRLIRAGEEGWDKAVLLWNGMMAKAPALVLQPGDARDVATAVRFARDHGLLLSIKSGGHNMPSAPTSTSTSALAPFANSASTRSPWSTKPVRRCPRCNRPAGTPAASADSRSARCIW